MSAWNHHCFWGAWLVALATFLIGCGPKEIVDWPEIHGRVYDKATGKPLANAFVVAKWRAYAAGTMGGGSSSCIHAEVSRTDAAGAYVIPAWVNHSRTNRLQEQAIHLTVYLPGYKRADDIFTLNETPVSDFKVEKDDSPPVERLKAMSGSIPSCGPHEDEERQHMEEQMQPVYKTQFIEACRLKPESGNIMVERLLYTYLKNEYSKDYAREHAKEGCLYELD